MMFILVKYYWAWTGCKLDLNKKFPLMYLSTRYFKNKGLFIEKSGLTHSNVSTYYCNSFVRVNFPG